MGIYEERLRLGLTLEIRGKPHLSLMPALLRDLGSIRDTGTTGCLALEGDSGLSLVASYSVVELLAVQGSAVRRSG